MSEWQSMGFVHVGGSSCLLLTTCSVCVSGESGGIFMAQFSGKNW